jgi:glycosyltransferase involved in cell wall biosynthesis
MTKNYKITPSLMGEDETLSLSPEYSTTRRLIYRDIGDQQDDPTFKIKLEQGLIGGLRSKGYYKKSQANQPLISVITVVLNRRELVANAIKSLLGQSYDNIEYIIIDGLSTDGTLDVIRGYDQNIDYWISEPDRGLYEAMNKGIQASTGEWILVLNSDDILLESNILKDVSEYLRSTNADIVHGNMNVRYPNGRMRTNIPLNIRYLKKKMCLNHGSCFIRRSVYLKKLYDTSYRIAADYDFLLWAYLRGYKFEYINKNIIEYSSLGLTGTPNYGDFESYRIWKSYFGIKKAMVLFVIDQSPKFVKVPVKKMMIKFGLY